MPERFPLQTQVRDYCEYLDVVYPDVSPAEVWGAGGVEWPAPSARRRPGLVVAVAAAATLLLIGGVIIALGWLPGADSPVATTVPEPTTTVPPVTSTTVDSGTSTTLPPATTTVPPVTSTSLPQVIEPLSIVPIEPGGDPGVVYYTGHFVEMAVGSDGVPVVAFLVQGEGEAPWAHRLVRCADPTCAEIETLAEIPIPADDGFPGRSTYLDPLALELDSENIPTLAIYRGPPDAPTIILVRCTDIECGDYTSAELGTGSTPSLALREGRPVVLTTLDGWGGNSLVTCSDPACLDAVTAVTVAQGFRGFAPIALDAAGRARFAHTINDTLDTESDPSAPGGVFAVLCDDPACSTWREIQMVATDSIVQIQGFALDASGAPFVAYERTERGVGEDNPPLPGLYLVACTDPACDRITQPVRVQGADIAQLDMIIGSDGLPLLAYGNRPELLLIHCEDRACSEGTIARHAADGNPLWVAVDLTPEGTPIVAFHDFSGGTGLRLAQCRDVACLEGATSVETWDQTPPE